VSAALRAGALYFALIFAAGFVLGTLRVLALEPALGAWGALALELPVMLALSWAACGWTLRKLRVPVAPTPRLVMGAVFLLLLMAAEFGVSVLALGRSASAHFDTYRTALGLVGLAAQLLTASFPLLRR
jgi:hypothetical protein